MVELASRAPADLASLAEGSAPLRTVAATLHLPAAARRGLPAVVILDDGADGRAGTIYAGALAEAGIPALVAESGSPDAAAVVPTLLADADAAWRFLAEDGRFDRNRIGILGIGAGGTAALAAIQTPFAPEAGSRADFAAHMPVFPGCDGAVRDWRSTDAPVLIVVGEAGDDPPRDACLGVAEQLSTAGSTVATKVYRWPGKARAGAGPSRRPDLRGNVAADAVNFFEQALKPGLFVF